MDKKQGKFVMECRLVYLCWEIYGLMLCTAFVANIALYAMFIMTKGNTRVMSETFSVLFLCQAVVILLSAFVNTTDWTNK